MKREKIPYFPFTRIQSLKDLFWRIWICCFTFVTFLIAPKTTLDAIWLGVIMHNLEREYPGLIIEEEEE
jgi:hypothetical protein